MQTDQLRVPINVEVRLSETSQARPQEIEHHVQSYLSGKTLTYADGVLTLDCSAPPILLANVQEIRICDTAFIDSIPLGTKLMTWQVELQVFVYQANDDGPADAEDLDGGAVPSFLEWQLPCQAFCGLWDSLLYGSAVKQRLLQYATTTLLFGQQNVNSHLISFNRTILLHGPPGTGKTSLSKAIAQKLAIKFQSRYSSSQLIEVNAHSLFSKWFAESGKLVTGLFARIREAVEDDNLVFVLIDEVESLAAARQAAISGSEPADAVRAVNALLTGLDSLTTFSNVMVLTTSNLTSAIDLAFVDRADIKAYLGPPTLQARYGILRSCIEELQRCEILSGGASCLIPKFQDLKPSTEDPEDPAGDMQIDDQKEPPLEQAGGKEGAKLRQLAVMCEGMSGRTLRKLPFLAHVLLAQQCVGTRQQPSFSMSIFLDACCRAVDQEMTDRLQLKE